MKRYFEKLEQKSSKKSQLKKETCVKTFRHSYILLFLLLILPFIATGQGTIADYERAERLQKTAPKLVYHAAQDVTWIGESHLFWYRVQTHQGKEFILVDAQNKNKVAAFDHAKLAAELSSVSDSVYQAFSLTFSKFTFNDVRSAFDFAME